RRLHSLHARMNATSTLMRARLPVGPWGWMICRIRRALFVDTDDRVRVAKRDRFQSGPLCFRDCTRSRCSADNVLWGPLRTMRTLYVHSLSSVALAVATLAWTHVASAEGLALSRFDPAPAGDRFFGVQSPYAVGGKIPHLVLLGEYASEPL